MTAFIKSVKTWQTLAHAEAISWDVPELSTDNSVGQIVFPPDADVIGYEGEWIVIAGILLVIRSIKPTEQAITVNVVDAYNAFYRSHIMFNTQNTVGGFLLTALTNSYKNQGDAEYAMPYLTITNTDATPLIQPTLVNDTVFVMSDYLRMVSQRGVDIAITPAATGVDVAISTRSTAEKTVLFDDGHAQLNSQDFSADITSKVTAVINGVNNYYYLQADGTVAQTVPSPRIAGKWATVVLSEDADVIAEVEKIFAKNTAALKIDFASDKHYNYGDAVRVRIKDKVYKTVITSVSVSSNDMHAKRYKAGTMPVTLTDKLKLALNN